MRNIEKKIKKKKKEFSIRSVFVREYFLFFFLEKYDVVIFY